MREVTKEEKALHVYSDAEKKKKPKKKVETPNVDGEDLKSMALDNKNSEQMNEVPQTSNK